MANVDQVLTISVDVKPVIAPNTVFIGWILNIATGEAAETRVERPIVADSHESAEAQLWAGVDSNLPKRRYHAIVYPIGRLPYNGLV